MYFGHVHPCVRGMNLTNVLGECTFCVSELIPVNNLYSDLHAYTIPTYLAVSAYKLVCIMKLSPIFTL